jgi:phosphoribosyl-ATP pyrophosphohydrolase
MEDDEYKTQLIQIGNTIIEKVLEEMAVTLKESEDIKSKELQADCAALLLHNALFLCELNPKLIELCIKLNGMIQKNGNLKTKKFVKNMKKDIENFSKNDLSKSITFNNENLIMKKQMEKEQKVYQQLLSKFK